MNKRGKHFSSRLVIAIFVVVTTFSFSDPASARRSRPWYAQPRTARISKNSAGWNKQGKDDSFHFFTTSISGGYSLFLNSSDYINLVGGGGGAFTLGYEFRKPSKTVWFSIAAEYQLLSSSLGLNYPIFDRWINDSEGRLAMYHYDMIDGRDRQMAMSVSVPLMAGYYKKHFYIGAGPKFGYFFWGKAGTSLDYKTHATYDRYIDEYVDMPNHYYTNNSASANSSMKFNSFSVSLCFETGYEIMNFSKSKRTYWQNKYRQMDWIYILKLGVYAEYGFLDINGESPSGTAYAYDETNPFQLIVKPFYTTETPTSMKLNPFYAGVKLTFMFTAVCGRCRGKAKIF